MPGETFSYNATLGPRSTATGYKNAKVYENGEVVDGIDVYKRQIYNG